MPNLVSFQESINFLHQMTLLIGLSILTIGIFSYWKMTRQVKLPKHARVKQGKELQEKAQEAQQPEQPRQKVEEIEPETSEQDKDDQMSQPPPETGLAITEVVVARALRSRPYSAVGGSTSVIRSCMVFLSLPSSSRPVFISTSACFASSVRSSSLRAA